MTDLLEISATSLWYARAIVVTEQPKQQRIATTLLYPWWLSQYWYTKEAFNKCCIQQSFHSNNFRQMYGLCMTVTGCPHHPLFIFDECKEEESKNAHARFCLSYKKKQKALEALLKTHIKALEETSQQTIFFWLDPYREWHDSIQAK